MVSCTFTYDKPRAEQLADLWHKQGYRVQIGGPAYNDFGAEFESGKFLKPGYTITSRGCNNKCWFCYVPKREGNIRELPIVDGWNVLDSNLLQCSEQHIRNVFAMLKMQPERGNLTGGIEANLLQDWHIDLMQKARIKRLYFAFDTPDDYEPLVIASKKVEWLSRSHNAMCYVLIGYPKDSYESATMRLQQVIELNLTPMAMLYRDEKGKVELQWSRFQRSYARPKAIYANQPSGNPG